MTYNASIGTNANVSFGLNGGWNGSNPVPTSFALNGVTCNGGTTTPTTPPPTGSLPNSFRWNSTC